MEAVNVMLPSLGIEITTFSLILHTLSFCMIYINTDSYISVTSVRPHVSNAKPLDGF